VTRDVLREGLGRLVRRGHLLGVGRDEPYRV